MKIIKQGQRKTCKFECPYCGCEYIANLDECSVDIIRGQVTCYCPCCGIENESLESDVRIREVNDGK